MSRIGVIHTSLVFLLKERIFLPLEDRADLLVQHFVDSRLLEDFRSAGELTPAVTTRFARLLQAAEVSGCDIVISACSSLGGAADLLSAGASVPILKIDEPMAREAALMGGTVGVLATVGSTVTPSTELVASKQRALGRHPSVVAELSSSAFDFLMQGRKKEHDDAVVDSAVSLAARCDVLLLAQASMSRLHPRIAAAVEVPVLSSPELAFAELDDRLSAVRSA